jgi:hypothetical protein
MVRNDVVKEAPTRGEMPELFFEQRMLNRLLPWQTIWTPPASGLSAYFIVPATALAR